MQNEVLHPRSLSCVSPPKEHGVIPGVVNTPVLKWNVPWWQWELWFRAAWMARPLACKHGPVSWWLVANSKGFK